MAMVANVIMLLVALAMVAMGYFDLILHVSHSNQILTTVAWKPKYKYVINLELNG